MSNSAFALNPDVIYLNHAGVGPWPVRTAEAVERFARECATQGSMHYERWLRTEQSLRELLRELINAESTDEIALLKNTSEGLSVIAHGLDWKPGDNIVAVRGEFPSNSLPWASLDARNVEFRQVPVDGLDDPESRLIAAMDANTHLLTVSSVQYGTGLRLDLERLGQACKARDILFCVDAIQSLGVLPFDVGRIQADFVVADGHKWLCAPEGVALFYCRNSVRERLTLHQYGWHMLEHAGDFERPDNPVAASARRFEAGSSNMLGIHALHASLEVLLDVGMAQIAAQVLANSDYLFACLDAAGIPVVTPQASGRYAGIVTFTPPGGPKRVAELYRSLQSHQIICALRAGGIRFSPHFHTPRAQLARALALL